MSTAQAAANAANAQKSTGPKTPEGKERVRRNAQKHNFTGRDWVVLDHQKEAFERFSELHRAALRPLDDAQRLKADFIIQTRFRISDMAAASMSLITLEAQNIPAGETFETGDDTMNAVIDMTLAIDRKLPRLDLMGRYESRLHRILQQAEAEYRNLQKERRTRVEAELPDAIRAYNYCKLKGLTFNPEQFGFVCTIAEIEARIHRQQLWADIEAAEKTSQKPRLTPQPAPKSHSKEPPAYQSAS